MSSNTKSERGVVCAAKPFAGGFCLQSPQPHLKRFIMFDHSGSKGRVFFHPALAQELFGSTQALEYDIKGFMSEKGSNLKFLAYKQMVEGALTSLQTIQSSKQSDILYVQQPKATSLLPGALTSSQKPRDFETISKDGILWAFDDQFPAQQCMASKTLLCEEKVKVSAIPTSPESLQDCKHLASPFSSSSRLSSAREFDVSTQSDSMQENTEDLDALLSSDEDEDEDEDVRSTGHSPDELLCKGESFCEEEEEVEQLPNKKRKIGENCPNESKPEDMSAGEEVIDKTNFPYECGSIEISRRQKIKRTVKALRRMIPGGGFTDAALVLDETITYVKTLQDRVNQLEATRLQSYHHP